MQKSIVLLIALVLGTVATVAANSFLSDGSGVPQIETTEIFVASAAIDVGEELTPEKVKLEQWPADRVPTGTTGDFEELKDKYAKQKFYPGEAIMPVKLTEESWSTVPSGYSVVAMPASDVNIANLIQPGDRVDVLAYFEKSELIPRSVTKTVLSGIRVYALDGDTERRLGQDRPTSIRNIQLLVHKDDIMAWTYAGELGRLQLALGSEADYTNVDGSNRSATEFVDWIEDYRTAQEEARRLRDQPNAPATPESEPVEEGYRMVQMQGERLIEYLIVDGKLPKKIGEVGGSSDDSSSSSDTSRIRAIEDESTEAGNYDYLTGEESPLFQPSGE
ncbi:MAG: Flp pilus assembly protein CpaB [Planctomycetota bacterium]